VACGSASGSRSAGPRETLIAGNGAVSSSW
jgi:hypothetical protein